jgi:hypothetical protein
VFSIVFTSILLILLNTITHKIIFVSHKINIIKDEIIYFHLDHCLDISLNKFISHNTKNNIKNDPNKIQANIQVILFTVATDIQIH